MSMKNLDQINRECAEMWGALNEIPLNDPGRDRAFDQAAEIEKKMWERYFQQEYFSEFELCDGVSQHRDGYTYEQWKKSKKIVFP